MAYPTETFYGVTVDAWQPAALRRLTTLKQRDPAAPLSLILADLDQLHRVVARVPAAAQTLVDAHWPGPLTLVLPARDDLPAPLRGAHGVGVRLSPHPVARSLATRFDAPLVATSANHRGEPAPRTAGEALRSVPELALVVDGGPTPGGAPSTVVAVDLHGNLNILRQGAIDVS